ncbi:MAG: hypothetical protein K6A44_03375 [bacterium]|nr:hypothetical protein [bacterium]
MLADNDSKKINKIIPLILIFIFIIWFVLPLLLTTGAIAGGFIFPIIVFVLGTIGNILFWGLIIYAFVRMFKNYPKKNELPETPEKVNYVETEQEKIPDYIHEEAYVMQTSEYDEAKERRMYEKEIFPYVHPKLYAIQKNVIPFIWFLIILSVIIAILVANGVIEIPTY